MSPEPPSLTISKRLRLLIGTQPSPEQYAFALEQLGSRRSGSESLAARALASWGRTEDRRAIKAWFEERWPAHGSCFRPDLIEIFRRFTDPTDVAWLVDRFVGGTTGLRTSLSFVLREQPDAHRIAADLVARADPQLTIDTIHGLMWSRGRYGRILQHLASSDQLGIRQEAERRLALFNRFPDRYR